MANAKFNAFKVALAEGTINLESDALNLMLVDSTYSPDIDTHSTTAHITGEVSGTGYTAGGKALTGQSVTQDNDNDTAVLDADNVTWEDSSITAKGAVLYHETSGTLIAYFDFGSEQVSSEGDFVVQWNSAGILTLS